MDTVLAIVEADTVIQREQASSSESKASIFHCRESWCSRCVTATAALAQVYSIVIDDCSIADTWNAECNAFRQKANSSIRAGRSALCEHIDSSRKTAYLTVFNSYPFVFSLTTCTLYVVSPLRRLNGTIVSFLFS